MSETISSEGEHEDRVARVQRVVDKCADGTALLGHIHHGLEAAAGDDELMGKMVDAWVGSIEKSGGPHEKAVDTVSRDILDGAEQRGTTDQWLPILESRGYKAE